LDFSQSKKKLAYVHFIGVKPSYRKNGIGRILYNHFFQVVKEMNVQEVECLTSNLTTSIDFS